MNDADVMTSANKLFGGLPFDRKEITNCPACKTRSVVVAGMHNLGFAVCTVCKAWASAVAKEVSREVPEADLVEYVMRKAVRQLPSEYANRGHRW